MTTENFQEAYETVFAGEPWYGKGVLASLTEIPENWWHRPAGHQTIARLVGHLLAWRTFIVAKLRNNDAFHVTYQSTEEWPEVNHLTSADLLEQLGTNQQELLAELARIDDRELEERVPVTYKYTKEAVLNGVLRHDIYHLGQINLIVAQFRHSW